MANHTVNVQNFYLGPAAEEIGVLAQLDFFRVRSLEVGQLG
jgi:hypothetical protein